MRENHWRTCQNWGGGGVVILSQWRFSSSHHFIFAGAWSPCSWSAKRPLRQITLPSSQSVTQLPEGNDIFQKVATLVASAMLLEKVSLGGEKEGAAILSSKTREKRHPSSLSYRVPSKKYTQGSGEKEMTPKR
uniref:Uncharacterized protein n=1 Tax=Sphaerodactylus townsendi TaxID=933632 RepID=A0ACB8EI55_9SAUR